MWWHHDEGSNIQMFFQAHTHRIKILHGGLNWTHDGFPEADATCYMLPDNCCWNYSSHRLHWVFQSLLEGRTLLRDCLTIIGEVIVYASVFSIRPTLLTCDIISRWQEAAASVPEDCCCAGNKLCTFETWILTGAAFYEAATSFFMSHYPELVKWKPTGKSQTVSYNLCGNNAEICQVKGLKGFASNQSGFFIEIKLEFCVILDWKRSRSSQEVPAKSLSIEVKIHKSNF